MAPPKGADLIEDAVGAAPKRISPIRAAQRPLAESTVVAEGRLYQRFPVAARNRLAFGDSLLKSQPDKRAADSRPYGKDGSLVGV